MRKLHVAALAAVLMTAGCLVYVPDLDGPHRGSRWDRGYDAGADISYFYDALSPYGDWVLMPPYGYVWIPEVGYGWRPYTYGRWLWTDDGWMFDSPDRWGWAVFHYGRWGHDRRLGWFWVPDIDWAPAWVVWRWGGLHIGWAPLPPGVEFSRLHGLRHRDFDIPGNWWAFIDGRYFMDRDLHRWVLPYERNVTIINYTVINPNLRVRDGRVVNDGVDLEVVRRHTRQEIRRVELQEGSRPGDARVEEGRAVVYRPQLQKNESARPRTVLSRGDAEAKAGGAPDTSTGRIRRVEDEPIDQLHERERRLLRESQESEAEALKRDAEDAKKSVRSNDDKKRIEADAKVKAGELKKKHDAEKQEIDQRQKDEKASAEKGRIRKK